jgi:hypothetical protein
MMEDLDAARRVGRGLLLVKPAGRGLLLSEPGSKKACGRNA